MSRLAICIAALSLAGIAITGYLSWVHFAELEPFCVGGGGACERVKSSPYAELAGIPVAVVGLGGYLAILASLAWSPTMTAFLGLVGMGLSAYLTYIALAVIDATCQWCMASAVVMTAIAVASVARLVARHGGRPRPRHAANPDGSGQAGPHTGAGMPARVAPSNDVTRRPADPTLA